jgi:hypothetical protein
VNSQPPSIVSISYGECEAENGAASNPAFNGALSTSATSLARAYAAGTAWNFAAGLGSLDAYNLVTNWSSGQSRRAAAVSPKTFGTRSPS